MHLLCSYFFFLITQLKMKEVDEEDALAFNRRLSLKKLSDGRAMGGASVL
jgi:hypothetical protein